MSQVTELQVIVIAVILLDEETLFVRKCCRWWAGEFTRKDLMCSWWQQVNARDRGDVVSEMHLVR